MPAKPCTGELLRSGLIDETDVKAAVKAFLANPELRVYPLGDGYSLDIAAAVAAHASAARILEAQNIGQLARHAGVHMAVLAARPDRA